MRIGRDILTFNSHPYVMGAMHEFLRYLDTPQARAVYGNLDQVWSERARRLNHCLREESLPVQVVRPSAVTFESRWHNRRHEIVNLPSTGCR
jgi:hypothetical protein